MTLTYHTFVLSIFVSISYMVHMDLLEQYTYKTMREVIDTPILKLGQI